MGWASGSSLFSQVIGAVQPRVKDDGERKEIYKKLINAFEESDWDTQDECTGEATLHLAAPAARCSIGGES